MCDKKLVYMIKETDCEMLSSGIYLYNLEAMSNRVSPNKLLTC